MKLDIKFDAKTDTDISDSAIFQLEAGMEKDTTPGKLTLL